MSFHVLLKGISSPICGYYSDKIGRKFTILIGGMVGLIGSTFLFFSSMSISVSIIMMIIGTLVLGVSRGFIMTSYNVIAGDIGENYRKVGQVESFCDGLYLVGAILGGASTLFLQGQTYLVYYSLILIFYTISFIGLIILIKETLKTEKLNNKEVTPTFSYKDVLKHENFIPTFFFAFTVEGSESGYIGVTIPIIIKNLGVTPDKSALYSTFPFSFGLMLFFFIAGYINDKKGRKFTALLGCILIMIFSTTATFLSISPILIFLIVFLLSGSSAFVRSTIESTWTDVSSPFNRGKTYGVFRFFNELGGVIQPLIMSLLLFLNLGLILSPILIIIFSIISFIIGKIYFKETLK